MRRRDLPLALAAFAQSIRAQQPGPDYVGALERHLTTLAEGHWDARQAAIAQLKNGEQLRARQQEIRRLMEQQIGGLPTAKTPLNAKVTGGFAREGYRVEHVVYESLPGFRVTANLYLPTVGKAPFPAVLGTSGHFNNAKAAAPYQQAWIGFALRGYAVLAFDPVSQGERLAQYDAESGRSRSGPGVAEHLQAGVQCLLTGHNIARYMVWDGIRGVDYLQSRPEIDGKRIAVAGNSGGGTQAAYLAVLEPRLSAVITSCYITRWRELWSASGPQDSEQVFAGFTAAGLDFGDFLLAAAPRPWLITAVTQDFFPIAGTHATHQEAIRLYERLGVSERAGMLEHDAHHGWHKPQREMAVRWLNRWLQGQPDSPVTEPPIRTEPESTLYVTPTGQLATSFGSETVQSVNAARARELAAQRKEPTREIILRRLAASIPQTAPFTMRNRETRNGLTIETLQLTVGPNLPIPAQLLIPNKPGRLPALVHVNGLGMAADVKAGDLEQLAASGRVVLALDPRGCGAAGPAATGAAGHTGVYKLAARCWMLNQTLTGMQVEDLLSAVRLLQSHDRVNPQRIAVLGKNSLGPIALMAAALEPAISRVVLEGSLLSLQELTEARFHDGWVNLIVPGMLQDFDLPGLLPLIAPRPVAVVSPVQPNGAPLALAAVKQRPGWGQVSVLERPEGWSAPEVYGNLLAG